MPCCVAGETLLQTRRAKVLQHGVNESRSANLFFLLFSSPHPPSAYDPRGVVAGSWRSRYVSCVACASAQLKPSRPSFHAR